MHHFQPACCDSAASTSAGTEGCTTGAKTREEMVRTIAIGPRDITEALSKLWRLQDIAVG